MRQQSSSATVRHGAEERTWDYSQRPTIWYTVETSVAASSHGGTWSEKRVDAGTFSLSGFSCNHAPLQEAILLASVARADDTAVSNIKITWSCLDNMTEPSDLSKHITTAVYNVLMSTSKSPMDLARLKAVVTPHAGDWLHAPPLTAIGLRLSDEAIRVAICYRLGTPHMRMWRNSRRQRSAWIGLPQEWTPSHTSLTAQWPDLASCQEGTDSGKQGTHRTIEGWR